jgi:hypothetical protein
MIATGERAAAEPGTRTCGYCGDPFDTKGNAARLYCTRDHRDHREKAAGRRRKDGDPRQPPERALVCPWCGAEFITRLAGQVFCTAAHRKRAMACDRRRGFLTLAAAEAAATQTPGPAVPFRCPHATAREHWHLGSVPS